ncbi:histidine kinase [Paenibacillus chartarius]|uniref:histidine kinase n=1 Tax=Paenibacillus chartarius TaxID=747481 RepID=A0ABV6DMY9_9BACL
MTIRTKLLLFIPLLVLLSNSVSFFLFQSGQGIRESYDVMMSRLLLYNQTVHTVEGTLETLNSYLVNPDTTRLRQVESALAALSQQQSKVAELYDGSRQRPALVEYVRMMETIREQGNASVQASGLSRQREALASYEDAERTGGFIQEQEQHLVDVELASYEPVYQLIQHEAHRMDRLAAAVFVVNTLLGLALAVWISRSVTVPVSHLVGVAAQIAKGNLNVEPESGTSKDELGILARAFRHMLSDLKTFIDKDKELLEKDKLVKELELKTLQSQINPHFLFNSLNVLSKLALLEGALKTSDLIVSMSRLFRYNLRKLDKPVTLRDELNHVQTYIAIQQTRFVDQVHVEISADESALGLPMPALTLQPLVENAYVHGISGMERDAHIRLDIAREPEHVTITITDNGQGMDEETRQSLLRLEEVSAKKESSGIGTRNVFKRMELFYGCPQPVTIESEPGKGTKITIRVPWRKEDLGDYVPIDDRR